MRVRNIQCKQQMVYLPPQPETCPQIWTEISKLKIALENFLTILPVEPTDCYAIHENTDKYNTNNYSQNKFE